MLKIEVIKFEAQDVITTSGPEPVNCICGDRCDPNDAGTHLIFSKDYPNGIACPAQNHDCIRPE